jgi:hypothetical protein
MRNSDPILLVEDDFLDIMTLKRGLKDINANNPLHVRYDGESALDFLRDPKRLFENVGIPRESRQGIIK